MDFPDLARACAPEIHLMTLSALVRHESAFNPLAIGINARPHATLLPRSRAEAVSTARALIEKGVNFDAGLGQINVRNWRQLQITPESVFDPCVNLAATQRLLTICYRRAAQKHGHTPLALHATFSCYNTGNLTDGFKNGYVRRVLAKADRPLSAVLTRSPLATLATDTPREISMPAGRSPPDALSTPSIDAFSVPRADAFRRGAPAPPRKPGLRLVPPQ